MTLPIDVIPNTSPARFRWRQLVTTPTDKMVECEGALTSAAEGAVMSLIALAKRQEQEIEGLRRMNDGLASQVEVATRQQATVKKGRGA